MNNWKSVVCIMRPKKETAPVAWDLSSVAITGSGTPPAVHQSCVQAGHGWAGTVWDLPTNATMTVCHRCWCLALRDWYHHQGYAPLADSTNIYLVRSFAVIEHKYKMHKTSFLIRSDRKLEGHWLECVPSTMAELSKHGDTTADRPCDISSHPL